MSLNENQPERVCSLCKAEGLFNPLCPVCRASKAGVEEQSLGVTDAPADNVRSTRQKALIWWPAVDERRCVLIAKRYWCGREDEEFHLLQRLFEHYRMVGEHGGERSAIDQQFYDHSVGRAPLQGAPPQNTLLPCPFCGVIPTRDERDGFVRHPYQQGDGCPLNQERDELFLPSNWNQRVAPSVVAGVEEKRKDSEIPGGV